jgi:hypothetical protein
MINDPTEWVLAVAEDVYGILLSPEDVKQIQDGTYTGPEAADLMDHYQIVLAERMGVN